MIAVQIANFFILKKDVSEKNFSVNDLIVWLIGFVIYRLLMQVDIIVGNTFVDIIITIIICVVLDKITKKNVEK